MNDQTPTSPEGDPDASYRPLDPKMEAQMRRRRMETRQRRGETSHAAKSRDWDNYRLEEEIGEGAAAVVYRAVDRRDDSDWALKIFRKAIVADAEEAGGRLRWLTEAMPILIALDGPHLVRIHELIESDQRHALRLEMIEGQSLDAFVRERDNLSFPEAIDIAVEICDGTSQLHKAGIVHRDIKPRNVVVTPDRGAILMDPGSARPHGSDLSDRSIALSGTPQTMAPELLRGQAATPSSDVYSLGVLLYYALTRKMPYKGPMVAQLREEQRQPPPPPSSRRTGVPPALDAVAMRALAVDPDARYASPDEMSEALRHAGDVIRSGRSQESTSGLAARWRSLPGPIRALVFVLLVGLLLMLFYFTSE